MEGLGYGPGNRLKVKVSTRDFATYRDPAVIFVDQLNKVHFDAELEVIESRSGTIAWCKKDYTVGAQHLRRRHRRSRRGAQGCLRLQLGANYTQYCTPRGRQAARSAVAGNRSREAQGAWCGRSSACWPRTWPGPSSTTTAPRPAGTPISRATCTRRTAFTTTGVSSSLAGQVGWRAADAPSHFLAERGLSRGSAPLAWNRSAQGAFRAGLGGT